MVLNNHGLAKKLIFVVRTNIHDLEFPYHLYVNSDHKIQYPLPYGKLLIGKKN